MARNVTPNFYEEQSSEKTSTATKSRTAAKGQVPDKRDVTRAAASKTAEPEPVRNTTSTQSKTSGKAKTKPAAVPKPIVAKAPQEKTAKSGTTSKQSSGSASGNKGTSTKSAGAGAGVAILQKYPLDAYGLAAALKSRWDFNNFIISEAEAARLRAEGLRIRLERLSNAFAGLSTAMERRQRNIRNAAVAGWLISHARNARHGFAPAPYSTMHLATVHSTLRSDSESQKDDMRLYVPLRNALNDSVEMEKAAGSALQQSRHSVGSTDHFAVTVSNAEHYEQLNAEVIKNRVPPLDALQAALEAEALIGLQRGRSNLSSFTPPAPDPGPQYETLIDPQTPMPADIGSSRKRVPEQPVLAPPEVKGALVPTTANAGILAAADGTIAYAGEFRGYDNMIILQHGADVFSVYSNLGSISVVERQSVKQGDLIGRAGITSNQSSGIHYQVRKGASPVDVSAVLGARPITSLISQ